MPLSDHAVNERKGSGGGDVSGRRRRPRQAGSGRDCIPIDVNDASKGLLSPILSHLPSLSGLALKGLLPISPTGEAPGSAADTPRGIWQEADLRDGHGKSRLLLVSSPLHALQIFRFDSSVIPDDPHVQESFPAPAQVFSLPVISYDDATTQSALEGADVIVGQGRVLSARLLFDGPMWRKHGPVVALITLISQRKSLQGSLAFVVVSLRSGKAIKHVSLGFGASAGMAVSPRAIAISVSHPAPAIHVLDTWTLQPLHPAITPLPIDQTTSLPVMALSGRLLAFATSAAPSRPGPEGVGSLVTARSTTRARPFSGNMTAPSSHSRASTESSQGALLSSAVEIGGGVARGVWAGIKLGARAANQARNSRLARSAPAEASGSLADEERDDGDTESRSLEESSVLEESITPLAATTGEWVQVVDIAARRRPDTSGAPDETGTSLAVIAHFRAPRGGLHPPSQSHIHYPARPGPVRDNQAISFLSFNATGTQLLVAPADGRIQHIFEINPHGATITVPAAVSGEVWHLYDLRRGNTSGSVCEVNWSKDGRWIGVCTSKGTIHVFPINPTGGPASSRSHVVARNVNPQQLYPLSTVVSASTRLRPPHLDLPNEPDATMRSEGPGHFAFADVRVHPLDNGSICHDVVTFRPVLAQIELSRLTLRAVPIPAASSKLVAGQRRASALTEMMRTKAFGEGSDLEVKKAVKARWLVPLDADLIGPVLLASRIGKRESDYSKSSLAYGEIHTYCTHPHILPGTIYLSAQVDFFAARPIDDFSPLSIMDPEARTKRLVYRPQVEARPTSPEVMSFDEPLLSALHSMIESPSNGEIPGLPNGHPGASRWRTIPIRQVTAGLGEGVDRVRREYARAQHTRARRRASMAAHNGLSFEEETIFAAQEHEDDGEASSPSSALMPATNTESSGEGDDDEWAVGWEEEYARAVEEDGGPEELVLGLMDEEEEERRKWAMKQKERFRGSGQK